METLPSTNWTEPASGPTETYLVDGQHHYHIPPFLRSSPKRCQPGSVGSHHVGLRRRRAFRRRKRINSSAALIVCGAKERKSHGWTDLWRRSTLVKAGVFFTETQERFTRLEDRARNKVTRHMAEEPSIGKFVILTTFSRVGIRIRRYRGN